MGRIVLLDTSIYLNVLDVPGRNQERTPIHDQLSKRVADDDHFLLPMATIWETGNHIARLKNGGLRRKYADTLLQQVSAAMDGRAPYRTTHFPDRRQFLVWLQDFPEYAARNKSPTKPNEGISLADLSIIKEWQHTRALHPLSHVLIWSLDSDLAAYDTSTH